MHISAYGLSTTVTTHALHENASFGQAVKMADANLAQHNMFELFVDIKRSRLERILPLPSRIENNGAWSFDNTGVEHDSCLLDVKEHDRFDLSRLANTGRLRICQIETVRTAS